ncbi:MAG: hypothetical protein Q8Q42_00950 [Nanoarchaeota archaeon]|nr:hypothetical protein [Nanoarchaeota archaeon]
MERFYDYVNKAIKSYTTADHMVHMTYQVVHDPKIMLLAATHLYESLENAVSAILYYDYYFKRIQLFPQDPASRLDIFTRYSCSRHNIPRETVRLIQDIRAIHSEHKSSEMEFRRKNSFIIATKNYRLRTLNSEKLKSFLNIAKPLISKIIEVKKLNDRRIS